MSPSLARRHAPSREWVAGVGGAVRALRSMTMRNEHRSIGPRVHTALGVVVLVLGVAGCSLDRTGATGEGGSDASASGTGGAPATTTGATTPASSGVEAGSTADASSGSGSTTDVGGGQASSAETASSGGQGDGGGGGDGGATASSTDGSSSSGSGGEGPVCGDDDVEGSEACDDGNEVAGDGCGPTCLLEMPDDCPGTPIPLDASGLEIRASTVGANDTLQDTQGEGFCIGGQYDGADLIYAVVPAVSGTLRAELAATYDDHFLVLRTSCESTGDDILDCDYGGNPEEIDRVDAPVQAGQTYFVIVDSYEEEEGDFTLTLQLVP
jgi:cysteine-rich repeat protein